MQTIFHAAQGSGLFQNSEIKVRINPYSMSMVDGVNQDFIHVFGNIMEGRSDAQKLDLSQGTIASLNPLFPDIQVLSINIRDFDKASYFNMSML